METVKIRGLARLSAWMFGVWGAIVFAKSFYDLAWGEPESNLYAPAPWAFVSRDQWFRYAGFETTYGLACCAIAYFLYLYARFLPEEMRRRKQEMDLNLFK